MESSVKLFAEFFGDTARFQVYESRVTTGGSNNRQDALGAGGVKEDMTFRPGYRNLFEGPGVERIAHPSSETASCGGHRRHARRVSPVGQRMGYGKPFS